MKDEDLQLILNNQSLIMETLLLNCECDYHAELLRKQVRNTDIRVDSIINKDSNDH